MLDWPAKQTTNKVCHLYIKKKIFSVCSVFCISLGHVIDIFKPAALTREGLNSSNLVALGSNARHVVPTTLTGTGEIT